MRKLNTKIKLNPLFIVGCVCALLSGGIAGVLDLSLVTTFPVAMLGAAAGAFCVYSQIHNFTK